jgi:tol-pal system protein YbgF
MTSPQFSINLLADYRHTTTDLLDGGAYNGKSKDGFFNGRVGVMYYMNKRDYKSKPADQDLLAMDRAESGQVEGAKASEFAEGTTTFNAKLDKMEASESENNMAEYNRLKGRADELNRLIDGKGKEIDDLKVSLEMKDQRILGLEKDASTAGSGQGEGSEYANAYQKALNDFYTKNYESARTQFSSLRDRYPNHKFASNCQYWMGECYFGMGDYQNALEAFKAVLTYGFSYKKDDATLMMARCYVKLKDMANARSYFQELLNSYPDSEYIEKAKEWLSRVG